MKSHKTKSDSKMVVKRGIWIAFEGNEGSGKSTQISKLAEYLKLQHYKVTLTREPGGNEFSEIIRKLIFDEEVADDPNTQLLLFAAARRRNIIDTVLPALERGEIVLSDRSEGSSYAYQYAQFGLPFEQVKSINEFATSLIKPDLTIVLDVDVEIGMERARQAKGDQANHFDHASELNSMKRTLGYLRLANKFSNWVVLDVNKTKDEVFDDLIALLKKKHVII